MWMMFVAIISLLVLVQQCQAGLCRLPPIQEQICQYPVAFNGEVTNVEEVSDTANGEITTRIYKIRVAELFRKKSDDIQEGDEVTLVAPNQGISTRIYLNKGRRYFIRGALKNVDGEKEVMSSFCGSLPMWILSANDLKYIRGNFKCKNRYIM